MNLGEAAGYIAAGCVVFIAVIVKLRSLASSESRKVKYDEASVKWEFDRQSEIVELRKERAKMWDQRVKDAQNIAKLEAEVIWSRQKIGVLEQRIAILEAKTP